ncbi:MAG: hypothetical protein R3268_12775 [Acidiferrobacterales bacterium]|nr:hypothetical protein [Acidiferrobacterales bacterium]
MSKALNGYYRFLLARGAGEIDHYGRPLLAHLKGTFELLRQWHNPDEVCVAGLFHSVYGTENLTANGLDLSYRAQVQALIGRRSEELALLFCVADRTALLTHNALPPYHVVRHDSGETVPISAQVLSALLEIGSANLVEKIAHLPPAASATLKREVGLFQGMQEFLSAEAGRALFFAHETLEDVDQHKTE